MSKNKRSSQSKRTTLPRDIEKTKSYYKDWDRLSESGKYDMTRLKEVMLLLIANEGPLSPEWDDHELKGKWAGHRECHVGGDFLLVYRLDDVPKDEGAVIFVRTGSHAELFG